MAKKEPFIAIYRAILKEPFATNPIEAHFWFNMIARAAYKSLIIETRYGPLELRQGEIFLTRRKFAAATGLSEKMVRKCLQIFEKKYQLIENLRAHWMGPLLSTIGAHYKIKNYPHYTGVPVDPKSKRAHCKNPVSPTDRAHSLITKQGKPINKKTSSTEVVVPPAPARDSDFDDEVPFFDINSEIESLAAGMKPIQAPERRSNPFYEKVGP